MSLESNKWFKTLIKRNKNYVYWRYPVLHCKKYVTLNYLCSTNQLFFIQSEALIWIIQISQNINNSWEYLNVRYNNVSLDSKNMSIWCTHTWTLRVLRNYPGNAESWSFTIILTHSNGLNLTVYIHTSHAHERGIPYKVR